MLSPGGASNRPVRERRYGHLESAAVAKQQRDMSPSNRLRVDSMNGRYSSDPVKYTRTKGKWITITKRRKLETSQAF